MELFILPSHSSYVLKSLNLCEENTGMIPSDVKLNKIAQEAVLGEKAYKVGFQGKGGKKKSVTLQDDVQRRGLDSMSRCCHHHHHHHQWCQNVHKLISVVCI